MKSIWWIIWVTMCFTAVISIFVGIGWVIVQAQQYTWSRVGAGLLVTIAFVGWIIFHREKQETAIENPERIKVLSYNRDKSLNYWERGWKR